MPDKNKTGENVMDDQNLSEAEQMYLIAVALLKERGDTYPVSISAVAEFLSVAGVSANQMVHKLDDLGWLKYQPYSGIRFSEKGEKLASQILRHRRLWQIFLEEKLGLDSDRSDEIACRLEHIVPCDAVTRLSEYLGNPTFTREGLPVPVCDHVLHDPDERRLSAVLAGHEVEVCRLEVDVNIYQFLRHEDVMPGRHYTVDAVGTNALVMRDHEDRTIHLTRKIANQIWVVPLNSLNTVNQP